MEEIARRAGVFLLLLMEHAAVSRGMGEVLESVMLLGDAAWCVTVFAGYGATLALDGADRLGAAIAAHGDDLSAALDSWETSLRPEVRKRQALARKGMSRFTPPSRAHVLAGELMLRAIQLPGIRGLVQRSIQRANN